MGDTQQMLEELLRVMVFEPDRRWYGLDLSEAAMLPSGTISPALARGERLGLLVSAWEGLIRPRRRLYWLSPEGEAMARSLVHSEAVLPSR